MKKIGLLTDLHLEGSNVSKLNNPGWDYLVIAGDLSTDNGLIDQFFSYKAPDDIPIIYIPGNHEFEGKRIDKALDDMRELLLPFENVNFLYNESVVIDDIKFIGSTLWTNFELYGLDKLKENMDWAKNNVVDFTYIFNKKENGKYASITPQEMAQMCNESIEFLDFELRHNPFEGEKVVVTHFAPHKNSIDPHYSRGNSSYWVSNLEHLMGFSRYWLHGHIHSSANYNIEGTDVICNPRGYSKLLDLSSNKNFDKELILPIESILTNNNSKKFKY